MPFSYERAIHFADTDAAGVMFFANYFALCHEAYEEALAAAGLELGKFFADNGVIVPIARSEAEYHRSLTTGDRVRVDLVPTRKSENSFEVRYTLFKKAPPEKRVAVLRTEHVCIDSKSRYRRPLPPALAAWVDGAEHKITL